MKVKTTFLFAVLLIVGIGSTVLGQGLDEGLKDLSKQIAAEMSDVNKQKIAIIEFSNLDGQITEFGKFLSEELITRLFMTKKFEVVERQLLNKVLDEHKLTLTGFVDESTAKKLGKILGVDAICSGTVTDLGNYVKINARIVSTETGSVFAVAAGKIVKDEEVKKLMGKMTTTKKLSKKTNENKISGIENKIFYSEDFSKVEEGMLPKKWIGADHLMVKKVGNKKFLTAFEPGHNSKFKIPNINFPENFKLDILLFTGYNKRIDCYIGNIHIALSLDTYSQILNLNNASIKRSWFEHSKEQKLPDCLKQTITVSLVKKGHIFKVFIDDKERLMIRKNDFNSNHSIIFHFSNYKGFKLYSIKGAHLEK